MKQEYRPFAIGSCRLLRHVLVAFCLVAASGCRSTDKSASGGFASVMISGNTPGQIRNKTVEVFRADGYKVARSDPDHMIFEKEGSGMNNFAYGNWVGDTLVWVRVKASVVAAGEMTFRLQCRAYIVRDIGGSTEEEIPLSGFRKGPYQKLLEEVARRFSTQ
jgi:hypothetical protein